MATKKSSNSKTKTTTKQTNDEKILKVDIQEEETLNKTKASEDPINLEKIYELIGSLQAEVKNLKEENKVLKQEAESRFIVSTEIETIEDEEDELLDDISTVKTLDMDDPNRKITVYHTQEMSHNLSTYIKLSTTKRNLRRAGEVVRFSLNDFEENL